MSRKTFLKVAGGAAAVLIVLQFIQPARTNPSSDPDASFAVVAHASPDVVATLQRSCGDCHSNQTVWPWYSYVAPVSWMISRDVRDGRSHLNFSEWNRPGPEGKSPSTREICEEVQARKMPLRSYTWLHPQARLNEPEIAALCAQPVGPGEVAVLR